MVKETLRRLPLFSKLPDQEIDYLATNLRLVELEPGVIVLEENVADEYFLILLEGEVEIIKAMGTPDERLLGVRDGGTVLGEMALFSQDKRHTASIRARSKIRVLEMSFAEFDALLNRQPQLAYSIARVISHRLEEAENATIDDLREKNRELTRAYEELKAAQAAMIEKERMERELEIAKQIQTSILPQELPQPPGFECGACMIPARAVGGDFYDFIDLSDGRLGVVVGDVTDKGVPASLFMMLTYSLLRAEAQRCPSPGKTLREVNRHLLDINSSGMFVTILYGILDPKEGRFTYARAGHPYPLILDRDYKPVAVPKGVGQPLGLFESIRLDEQSILLPPQSLVMVFSDGLTEAMNPAGEELSEEQLIEIIAAMRLGCTEDLCLRLWEQVKAFTGSDHQQDDFTALVLKGTAEDSPA